MNESQQNNNSNNFSRRPQKPLIERLIRGNLSHIMPVILPVVWIVISFIAGTPIVYSAVVLLVLIPLWCIYRFGYQLQVNQSLKAGKYQQAVDVCLKALKSYPDDTFILLNLGRAYDALGQYEKADEYIEQAIQRGDKLPQAYLVQTKTIVHFYLNQQKNLIAASTSNPQGASAKHVSPQQLAEETTKYEAVLNEMDKVLKASKLQPPVLNITLAYYFARLGMLERAESELDKLDGIDFAQFQSFVLSNRSRIHLLRGEKWEALELSKKAIGLFSADTAILSTHGLMLLRNDSVEEAMSNFESAFKYSKDTQDAYWETVYFRGEAYEKMGDAKKAEDDKENALRHDYLPYL